MSTCKLNEVVLHYQIDGDGDETLLLFNDDHHPLEFWGDLPQQLADHYRVIRFDPRGAGQTVIHRDYCVDDVALDAKRLLDSLGIGKVVAIGNGWGGLAAQIFVDHWGMAQALVLCATGGLYRTDSYLSEDLRAIQAAEAADDEDAWVDALLRVYCAHPFVSQHPDTARAIALEIRQHPRSSFKDMPRTPPQLYWGKAAVPTLLLYGTEDRFGTREHCDDLYARVPAACQLVTMNDAGHYLIREQPARVVSEIRRFLRELSSGEIVV